MRGIKIYQLFKPPLSLILSLPQSSPSLPSMPLPTPLPPAPPPQQNTIQCNKIHYGHHHSISSIVKSHGGQLKATAAVVRLRLYSVLSLLPPELYENSFGGLLRELVAEYTLADNPGNTTTSMLGG